jgi:radical SAM protein with 4Fe4S-binding SPASM domain
MVINPEGTVSPCCAIYDSKTDFGDILNEPLEKVWNNSKFLSARSLFFKESFKDKKTTICDSCATILGEKYFKTS